MRPSRPRAPEARELAGRKAGARGSLLRRRRRVPDPGPGAALRGARHGHDPPGLRPAGGRSRACSSCSPTTTCPPPSSCPASPPSAIHSTVEQILEAGHEVGHHSYSHRSPVDLSEDEERADFERALAALERVGVRPSGHRAALWEASWRTPGLVAEYGLTYDSSLMDSDRPYRLRVGDRHDRRAAAPLEPRRLGAVRLPAAARHRRRDRVAAPRCSRCGGPSSTRCAATAACSCSPATRSSPAAPSRVEALRGLIEHALEPATWSSPAARRSPSGRSPTPSSPSASSSPVTVDPDGLPGGLAA